jgi:hypothetical protein
MAVFLTQREAEYCQAIIAVFKKDGILPALVAAVEASGLNTAKLPLLFELRFAKGLIDTGILPTYELPTLNETSVDFAFARNNFPRVLAELVSINVSDAVKAATQRKVDENGIEWEQLLLRTDNEDQRFSEEGEIMLVQQKICEKVFRSGKPVKFPVPGADYHVIVVDMRGFLGGMGGDNMDCIQLARGNGCVPEIARRFWKKPGSDKPEPILGLYEDTDRPRGAKILRERIHGILFIRDTDYVDSSIFKKAFLAHNPHLIKDGGEWDNLRTAVLG